MDTIPKTETECRLQSQLDQLSHGLCKASEPPTKPDQPQSYEKRSTMSATRHLGRRPSDDDAMAADERPNFFVPYVNDPDKAKKAWRGSRRS